MIFRRKKTSSPARRPVRRIRGRRRVTGAGLPPLPCRCGGPYDAASALPCAACGALSEQGEPFVPLGAYRVVIIAPRGRPQDAAQPPAVVYGAEQLEIELGQRPGRHGAHGVYFPHETLQHACIAGRLRNFGAQIPDGGGRHQRFETVQPVVGQRFVEQLPVDFMAVPLQKAGPVAEMPDRDSLLLVVHGRMAEQVYRVEGCRRDGDVFADFAHALLLQHCRQQGVQFPFAPVAPDIENGPVIFDQNAVPRMGRMFRNVEIGLRPHLQQQAVAFVGGPEQVDVDVAALTMRRNGVVPAQPQPLQYEHTDAVFGEGCRHLRGLFLLAAVAFLLPFGRQGPAEPNIPRRP